MKKFAKLSLVAAVAVAGMTTVNAQDLAEAIKGVDVSGTMTYRYDDRDRGTSSTATTNFVTNSYKIAITTKSPVNDDLTAVTRTVIGTGNGMASLDASGADSEAAFSLTQANFVYTGLANTSIIAGKQAVPSPFAVQADAAGDEDTGSGLTAITTVGPVTLAATYLQNTNLVTLGQRLAGFGAMGSVAGVALDAWYLDVDATGTALDGHQALTVGASGKIEMVSLYARYSSVDHDATANDKESLTKLGAKAKFGIIGVGVDYGFTKNVTTASTGVNLTGDADAKVNLQGWGLNLSGADDASLLKLNVNADVMDGINISANYNMLDVDSDATGNSDADEIYAQLTQKMGKNFMYYIRLGQVDSKNATTKDQDRGRLHVQYSF